MIVGHECIEARAECPSDGHVSQRSVDGLLGLTPNWAPMRQHSNILGDSESLRDSRSPFFGEAEGAVQDIDECRMEHSRQERYRDCAADDYYREGSLSLGPDTSGERGGEQA